MSPRGRLTEAHPGCGRKAGKGHKAELRRAVLKAAAAVANCYAALFQGLADRAQRLLRRIVVFAKVAQEHVAQAGAGHFGQETGRVGVIEVSVVRTNPCLQVFRIGSALKHLQVIIGLYHQEVGAAHIKTRTLADLTQVGGHNEPAVAQIETEPGIVRRIVRHVECGDGEAGQLEWKFLEDRHVAVFDALGDAVAAQDGVQHPVGAIETYVPVGAQQFIGEAHVVRMVVGQAEPLDAGHGHAVDTQRVRYLIRVHAGIHNNPGPPGADVAAVAAGAAAEGNVADRLVGGIILPCHSLIAGLHGAQVGTGRRERTRARQLRRRGDFPFFEIYAQLLVHFAEIRKIVGIL